MPKKKPAGRPKTRQRDYQAEYRRRHQRARELGFASYTRQRKTGRPRRLADLKALPEGARRSRTQALSAVGLARASGSSLDWGAKKAGTSLSAIRFWAPEAIGHRRRGKTYATRADRILRLRPLVVEGELTFVEVRGSRAADAAAEAWAVQWRYIRGEASELELDRFGGLRIGGRAVETDPLVLERLAHAGELDVAEYYQELVG